MLHYNTVSDLLKESLVKLMGTKEFEGFRLVGGTSLSLHLGHRESVDIDLFSDKPYGSIDFKAIDKYLDGQFPYVGDIRDLFPGMGKSYLIGNDKDNAVKLDVFHTDDFITPEIIEDGIRLASVEEIIAMKLDVVQREGRKKDFWDLHELLNDYGIGEMLQLHKQRYPYGHDRALIIHNFTNFERANDDFDPVCLCGKYWEFIKEDIKEAVEAFGSGNS
ncbi:nucleotidyl transferase AbiEii/AbiGii toxin family protein [Muricauda oceani]|uniref:nucleotidyl transferase AbiEii/AbiGii toxin family protein n=1 Tax=Flagellimonas oceani TaxID=2698672 RepID=UPI00197C825B|nr:nucleotidyl transferase AbiEii/AbiGii toxin family protein [Allomuricauda oceani]MBW8244824.1 nucleotidyl transferase AbiEii/AbiGii toxin family protein [Allomuricauda oceani]